MQNLVGKKVKLKVESHRTKFRDEIIEYFSYKLDDPEMKKKILALGPDVRILLPESAATMDFNLLRLNVHIDENGIITKISHG